MITNKIYFIRLCHLILCGLIMLLYPTNHSCPLFANSIAALLHFKISPDINPSDSVSSRKMVTLRLMWGLLVLCVVAASPRRYVRQAELDNYDNNNVDLDLNVDSDDVYDYYDGIDEPQVRESFKNFGMTPFLQLYFP